MDAKTRAVFLTLVLVQALHSLEEYAFEFYEIFPPARRLNELVPGIAHPAFIAFNVALLLFGLWCFWFPLRLNAPSATIWAWGWAVMELYNGGAHVVWAVIIRNYNPGLASALVLLALAAVLAGRLRGHSRASTPVSAALG